MKAKQQQLFNYLRTKRAGEVVTEAEILHETAWKQSTLKAYRSKHYTDPFLAYMKGGQYRVLRNGGDISETDIANAFTQVRPGVFVPTEGMEIEGSEGTYELKAHLGAGAVAEVWRCVLVRSGQERAAKLMNPRLDLLNPKVIENVRHRFSREARNGKGLSHPNLIPYRDYGEMDGHPFLIMDLAERSLATILRGSPLPLQTSIEVLRCCLLGLRYLHSLNCEHRDIKPDNILQIGSRFVLGDLGIVSWSDMNPAFTSAGTITRDSLQLGSWHYMAPEQRQTPHKVTPASDVYALGISWYEMLTQATPDPTAVGAKQFPPATTNSVAAELINRMLSYSPGERPSVGELLDRIERLGPSQASAVGADPSTPPRDGDSLFPNFPAR
jgi:serine/threonine protein kinase